MKPARSAYALFAGNILVWGYNWVPLHILVHRVAPAPLVAARVAGGALTLAVALLVMRRSLAMPKTRWFIPVGLLQVTGMMGLSTYALLLGDVSRTTILVFTMPFWATLFSRYVLQERIGRRKWIAIAIATCGLVFIGAHASGSRAAIAGAILSVLAGACWAAGSVLAKKHLSHHDLLNGVMWQQIAGAIPLIAFAAILRQPLVIHGANTLGWFLFATIAGTGLGWLLWANVLKRVSASAAALGSLGIPLLAAIAAYIQLHERPDAVTLTGLSAILAAIAISSWPVAQNTTPRNMRGVVEAAEALRARPPEPAPAPVSPELRD